MNTFGYSIPLQLFGESHGKAVGITINNLPAGIKLDEPFIKNELLKRRPKSNISTARQEQDLYQIISGYFNGRTTGSPLTFIIPNKDTRSKDYNPHLLRPSHSDYTAHMKYHGFYDYRGGGHFSGRLTAPLVIAGAIAKQLLAIKNIKIASHIASIHTIKDTLFEEITINDEIINFLLLSDFPLINNDVLPLMKDRIIKAKEQRDSVGGTIETVVLNLPVGIGGPYFETLEGHIAKGIYSIPAVKGLSFGKGFDITTLYGSEANDPFVLQDDEVKTATNKSGGIQGGISNGMPIIFKTAIKPTSSIGKPQKTVNIREKEPYTLKLKGRHDPAIVHRVVHVINAMTAYTILDILIKEEGLSWIN